MSPASSSCRHTILATMMVVMMTMLLTNINTGSTSGSSPSSSPPSVVIGADAISYDVASWSRPVMGSRPHTICGNYYWSVCWIANNGTVLCRTSRTDDASLNNAPVGVQFVSLHCGFGVCGLSTLGMVYCWSLSASFLDVTPQGVGYTSISMGYLSSGSCALKPSGTLECWGISDSLLTPTAGVGSARPPSSVKWRTIVAASSFMCGLTLVENHVHCFNATDGAGAIHTGWLSYADENTWTDLQCGDTHCCGLLESGRVNCFGTNATDAMFQQININPLVGAPAASLRFRRLFVSAHMSCGILVNGSDYLYCWGYMLSDYYTMATSGPTIFVSSQRAFLDLYPRVRASNILDMACNSFQCFFQTTDTNSNTTGEALIQWGRGFTGGTVNLTMDYYVNVITGGIRTGPIVGFTDRGDAHAYWSDPENTDNYLQPVWFLPSERFSTIAYARGFACGLRLQPVGQVSCVYANVDSGYTVWLNTPVEPFKALCAQFLAICGIRLNGTVACWGAPLSQAPNSTIPSSGGATHSDYVSITCNDYASCAIRSGGDVYCWGNAAQPSPRGPYISLYGWSQQLADGNSDQFNGITSAGVVKFWYGPIRINDGLPKPNYIEYFPPPTKYLQIQRLPRACSIDWSGVLTCSSLAPVDALYIGDFAIALNATHKLSQTATYGVCVVVSSQMICVGDTKRSKWGGWAMKPRAERRVVNIAPAPVGSDRPLCGIYPFKPCATLAYAMSSLELMGGFVTFQLAPGIYYVNDQTYAPVITISSANIVINGTTDSYGNGVTFQCHACISVSAPAVRILNIVFTTGIMDAIAVNSDVYDVAIINCVFIGRSGTAIRIASGAAVTVIQSTFSALTHIDGAAISVTSANVTVVRSVFTNIVLDVVSGGGAIYGNAARISINNCTFTNSTGYTVGAAIGMVRGYLEVTDSLFDKVLGGMIAVTNVPLVYINNTRMIRSACATGCAVTSISSTVYIFISTFLNLGAGTQGGAFDIYLASNLYIYGSSFTNVRAMQVLSPTLGSGGVIKCNGGSSILINGTSIRQGQATISGGVIHSTTCQHIITYVTIVTSSTLQGIGGCFMWLQPIYSSIRYSSFDGCRAATYGGAIAVSDPILPLTSVITDSVFVRSYAAISGACFWMDITTGVPSGTIASWPIAYGNTASDSAQSDDGTGLGSYCGYMGSPASVQLTPAAIAVTNQGQISYEYLTPSPGLAFNLYDAFGNRFAPMTFPVIPEQPVGTTSVDITTIITNDDGRGTAGSSNILKLAATGPTSPSFQFSAFTMTAPVGTTTRFRATAAFVVPGSTATRIISIPFNLTVSACINGQQPSADGLNCEACTIGHFSPTNTLPCQACTYGKFSNVTGMTRCWSCTYGKYIGIPGASACLDCAPGKYADATSAQECTTCQPGRAQPLNGRRLCDECGLGYYQIADGQPNCIAASAGSYVNTTGAIDQRVCDIGTFASLQASTACSMCVSGFYQIAKGQPSCLSCAPGTVTSTNGSSSCDECPQGRHQPDQSSSSCLICPAGTSSLAGAATCTPCSIGKFSSADESHECEPCAAGSAQRASLSISCDLCTPGRFSPSTGATECTPCGDSLVAPGYGATNCTSCGTLSHRNDYGVCVCDIGSYLIGDGVTCALCPVGTQCTSPGITLETLPTAAGWWRGRDEYGNATMSFYRCLKASLCAGGVANGVVCTGNRDGPLCALCQPGYTSLTSDGACSLCGSQGSSIASTVIFGVVLFAALTILYGVVLREGPKLRKGSLRDLDVQRNNSGGSSGSVYSSKPITSDRHGRHRRLSTAQTIATMEVNSIGEQSVDMTNTRAVILTNEARHPRTFTFTIKIIVGFLQIATTLASAISATWPYYFQQFLSVFNFMNFDFLPWQSVGCVASIDFYTKYLVVTLAPIVVILIIVGVVGMIHCVLDRRDRFHDTQSSTYNRATLRTRLIKAIVFTLFLLYPGVSSRVVSMFVCTRVDGQDYLVADFSVHCYDHRWASYLPYSICMILLYPIAIPVTFYFLLRRHAAAQMRLATRVAPGASSISFLYEAFQSDDWWFELVDMLHKFALTSLLVFFPVESQLPIALVVIWIYTSLLLIVKPYIRADNDQFHLIVQVELLLLVLSGYEIQKMGVDVDSTVDLLTSILLIAMCVAVFLTFLFQAAMYIKHTLQRMRREADKTASMEMMNHTSSMSLLAGVDMHQPGGSLASSSSSIVGVSPVKSAPGEATVGEPEPEPANDTTAAEESPHSTSSHRSSDAPF